jgi:hypothetical protein
MPLASPLAGRIRRRSSGSWTGPTRLIRRASDRAEVMISQLEQVQH